MTMNIGIVGNGYVGKATLLLECEGIKTFVYDRNPEKCSPMGIQMEELVCCDLVFVCVPTPMAEDGSCNIEIVNSVVKELKLLGTPPENIVIRSTVPVGTSEKLGVNFMPEFLTEANWEEDFKNTEHRIIGLFDSCQTETQDKFNNLFQIAKSHGKIVESTTCFSETKETEAAKLVRNCFLAVKVSFFNEIEEFCMMEGVDYKAVEKMTVFDDRIGDTHTKVPGHDGKRGYGGTCFPKDMNSLLNQMDKIMTSFIIRSAVMRNETIDRPEKDWEQDKGRAVSFNPK
jgi:UDPglucose 6-dehydrogenase